MTVSAQMVRLSAPLLQPVGNQVSLGPHHISLPIHLQQVWCKLTGFQQLIVACSVSAWQHTLVQGSAVCALIPFAERSAVPQPDAYLYSLGAPDW